MANRSTREADQRGKAGEPEGTAPNTLDEHDLANERHGSNRLQGDDQARVRNQRLSQPGALDERNQPSRSIVEEARRRDAKE